MVGGGPAGLSAAMWLGRHRRRTVLFDTAEGRNRWVDHSHGYLAADNVAPARLREEAGRELDAYPAVARSAAEVLAVSGPPGGPFEVATADGTVLARSVVLATGVVDRFPEVDGFFDHYGADVFHCPTCDGYEARGRRVVAFGWSQSVTDFALGLLDWAASVTVVTDGSRFEGDGEQRRALAERGVDVLEEDATAFVGTRGDLRGVRLGDGRTLDCELAFFSIAHLPRNSLARSLGCKLTEEGCIAVDEQCATSVEGVYAAGDVTPGLQLVQVAAAKGAIAGVSCALSLRRV